MVLTDARRENKILSEEVQELNSKLKSGRAWRTSSCWLESEGSAAVTAQLQSQLTQLQSNDTIHKARHQHCLVLAGEAQGVDGQHAMPTPGAQGLSWRRLSTGKAGQEMALMARVVEVAYLKSSLRRVHILRDV
jgi:hypothetical protein